MTDKFLYLFRAENNQSTGYFVTDGMKFGKLPTGGDIFEMSRENFHRMVKDVPLTETNLTNLKALPLIENSHIVLGTGITFRIPDEELLPPVDNIYKKIYLNKRPMIFMKGFLSTMAHNRTGQLFLREGVTSIPEAELVAVINQKNEVIGYTLGNDFTALDLEKENPLYQTQAKFFKGSFSLAEYMVITSEVPRVDLNTKVIREGKITFDYTYSMTAFVKDIHHIVTYVAGMNTQKGCFLFLGCGAKNPEGLSVLHGDEVIISSPSFPFELSNKAAH